MTRDLFGIGSRISHPDFGKGVIIDVLSMDYRIVFIDKGEQKIRKDDPGISIIERIEPDQDKVSLYDIEQSLIRILRKWSDISEITPLHEKWKKGTLSMVPFDRSMKGKDIPLEDFFHKIVMVRDRLRVLEQKVNSMKEVSEADKVVMQQYITRVYGSLTTFNILFKIKEDYFVGDKAKDED